MAGKEVATLFVEIRANFAKFQAQMGSLDKSFQALGKTLSRSGKLFTSSVTVPLAAVGAAAVAAAKDIDEAFDTIRAQSGETGGELDKLNASFEAVFGKTTQGAEEVGSAIAKLHNGLGLAGQPLEEMTNQVSQLARVTKTELGATVKGTVAVMNSWGVQSKDQATTLDFLFKVVQKTGISFEDLSTGIASNQPTFKALGLNLQESASLLGLLTKSGADSSTAIKALTFAVSKFAKAGVKDMGSALRTVFEGLKNAPSDTAAAAAAIQIFGRAAGPKFASLIRSGKVSLDDFVRAVQNSPETIGKAADATDSFGEKWAQFRNQVALALAPIGTPLLDALIVAMQALAPVLRAVGDTFKAMGPTLSAWVVGAGAVLAAIGPLLSAAAFLFGWMAKLAAIGPAITTVLATVGGALALLLTPLGLVAAAVGVAIAAWYEWDTVGPIVWGVADQIIAVFEELPTNLKFIWMSVSLDINNWIDETIERFLYLKDQVIAKVGELLEGIKNSFLSGFTSAKEAVTGFADDVVATFQGMYDTVVGHSIVPDMNTGVTAEMQSMAQNMTAATQQGAAGVTQSFDALLASLQKTSKEGAASGKALASAWKSTLSEIKSMASDAVAGMDPVRQKVTELLKAQDFTGLQKMAEGFKGSKDALDAFRSSMKDGKADYEEWKRNSDQLNTKLKDTQVQLYELSTGKKYIDPLTQSVTDLMRAGDMDGIKKLGESMQNTAEDSRAFDAALGNAVSSMKEMKAQGEELTSSLTSGLSGMMKNFGIDGEYADFFSGIFGGAVSGQGQGGAGMLGNLINSAFGGGNIFSSLLGGGSSAGGGSAGGGIMDSIMGALGLGGGTASAGNDLGSFFNMAGDLPDSLNLSSLSSSTSALSGGMGDLAGAMGGMGGYISIVNDSLQSLGKIGKTTAGTVEGLSQGGGAAIGAIFGGPTGAQIGSSIGKVVGKFLGGVIGGGPKNKDTIARNQVMKYLEDSFKDKNVSFYNAQGQLEKFNGDFKSGGSGRFNKAGWADDARAKYGEESTMAFNTLGRGITDLLGITRDIGPQIGNILQENLVGNLDNARILVKELGISQEDMTAQFEKLGETGKMSWHEVEVNLQQIPQLFGEGMVGVGNMIGGFDQIVNSAGDGMDAIYGIQNAAIEAGEAQVQNFEQWRAALLQAGADPAYVDAFFAALASRGLTTLDQIKEASTRVLGGVVADMESNSTALASQWQKAREEADKYNEVLAKIPDNSEKSIQLNVTANLDSNAQKVLDMPSQTTTTEEPQKFARGGVVNGPTMFAMGGAGLGIMGEAGPEAILPLSRVNGKLGVNVDGAMKGGNTYHIDARGASPGVEANIMRALASIEKRAVEQAVLAVAEMRDRGGTFADSF